MAQESPIITRFDATSTAANVVRGADLRGRQAIVTGASSGLGAETALALTAAGAAVTLAVRNVDAGNDVADRIAAATGRPRPQVRALDLADPASVAALISQWSSPLDILVNNAGLVTAGLERTHQGWELQFATNHLGHFALALGLHPYLAAAAAAGGGSRIVALSSTAHMRAPVDFDDIHFERRAYDPQIAYAQSKTANSLFAVEATRRWRDEGIVANAVNPGGVATGLQRNFSTAQRESLAAAEAAGIFTYKTIAQGAATTLVAAVAPEFAGVSGRYLDDCREAYLVPNEATLAEHPHGVKQWALDPTAADQLWRRSLSMITRLPAPQDRPGPRWSLRCLDEHRQVEPNEQRPRVAPGGGAGTAPRRRRELRARRLHRHLHPRPTRQLHDAASGQGSDVQHPSPAPGGARGGVLRVGPGVG